MGKASRGRREARAQTRELLKRNPSLAAPMILRARWGRAVAVGAMIGAGGMAALAWVLQ